MRFTRSHATRLIAFLAALLVTLPAIARAQDTASPGTPAAPAPAPSAEPSAPATQASTPPGDIGSTATASASGNGGEIGGDVAPANIRLRRLEQRVQALKEQAWRVKARVGMLKEAVLGGGIGARATILHQNKMGGSFRLVKLVYALDGAQIFSRSDDSGKLNELKQLDILAGPIAPGNHTISVLMEYNGHGYGVFAYLKGYKFKVRSSHTFTVSEGKQTQITVVGYERGGVTTPLEKRPAVDFKVNVVVERLSSKGK
ncbi:MAG: hypothetical protein HY698_02085 [Deltaproteobacteria bacterium]|nr:hypothetical protein [Deltaproteobacteria bacterium]